jgi:NAD(P)-dependent dehydrogenase (short-subunit alcohol dehydrogenase family)
MHIVRGRAMRYRTDLKKCLRCFLRTGSIIFISTVSADAATSGTAGVGAAVAMFVPILTAELRPLRVNGVSPAVVETPWLDSCYPTEANCLRRL